MDTALLDSSKTLSQENPSLQAIADYYNHLSASYFRYSFGTYSWHHGIWDSGVKTFPEALIQSNKRLVQGLTLTSETHILDMGCGMGGLAVWLAKNFGCHVTGITICESHLAIAETLAALHQVLPLCKFLIMDMSYPSFSDQSFDLVINQETFCHVVDKRNFLKEVHRILKPGGIWRGVEFSLQEEPLSKKESRWYKNVLEGFHIPSFLPGRKIESFLEDADFTQIQSQDLTRQVQPTARFIIRKSYWPLFLSRIGLDNLVFPKNDEQRKNFLGHFKAGMAYSRGLLTGAFRHFLFSAQKNSSMFNVSGSRS